MLCCMVGVVWFMLVVDCMFGDGVYGGMVMLDEFVFDVVNVLMGVCVVLIFDEFGCKFVFFLLGLFGVNVLFDDVF